MLRQHFERVKVFTPDSRAGFSLDNPLQSCHTAESHGTFVEEYGIPIEDISDKREKTGGIGNARVMLNDDMLCGGRRLCYAVTTA